MNEKPILKYFTGSEADQFTFYRIPKALFSNKFFSGLSTDAKVLYGLMLDRIGLSVKNNWMDQENHAFIYFSVEDTMELLKCKKNKAIQTIAELDSKDGIGLIEKKRQGQGRPTRIYVKSFYIPKDKRENHNSEVGKTNFLKFEKSTSGCLENQPLEVGISNPNKNIITNTDFNEIKSNLIGQQKALPCDIDKNRIRMNEYADLIKKNIEYDILLKRYPLDQDIIEGIYELILETIVSKRDEIVIASDRYPAELVRSRFLELDYSHIEYVMGCIHSNTTKVRNIKKYMLAALFNAPATAASYYQAEVMHDFPELAR